MNNKIIDTPNPPIKNWKDALIRIGIPVGLFLLILFALIPTMEKSLVECIQYHQSSGDDSCLQWDSGAWYN